MKFDVYGRKLDVIRHQNQWRVLIAGSEGKKRLAEDIMVPSHIPEEALAEYLADLCHEWSRKGKESVLRID